MKKIEAKIVADSVDPRGNRITTYLLTYPRSIHSELMTHRMFSRNSASSRAIPFKKMVKMVEEDPFIPIAWQKDHSGMQGAEYFIDKKDISWLIMNHLKARDQAIERAADAHERGLTKQVVNRYLEPYMWHTVLVTATEYDNFFELRCPKYLAQWYNSPESLEPTEGTFKSKKDFLKFEETHDLLYTPNDLVEWLIIDESGAEIHIQALAEAMWDAKNESIPNELKEGEWHIPFGDRILEISNFDYTITRDSDLDFHRHRIMFIIKDDKVIIAPQGTSLSHTEYFGNISGLIRGFRWNDEVYTYIDNFIPIESKIVQDYFSELTCYAGAKDFFHYKYGESELFIKIATARCARLSYMTFDGEINYEKDIELHDKLLSDKHFSPFEHCAKVMGNKEYGNFIKGKTLTNYYEDGFAGESLGWCNNFKGFIPYRYLIENQ